MELKTIGTELNTLGKRRSTTLSFLSDSDSFKKYKQASAELVTLRADVAALERRRNYLHKLQELRAAIRTLKDEKSQILAKAEADVEMHDADHTSKFSRIRLFFSEFAEEVLQRKALLSVLVNNEGHLDFKAEILDEAGNTTSADLGHTYLKLLCIAFDMSILRAHLKDRFPRFAYHDGVFESLDDRKKETLVLMLRRYADLGLQPIITLIDSDLPPRKKGPHLSLRRKRLSWFCTTRVMKAGSSRCRAGDPERVLLNDVVANLNEGPGNTRPSLRPLGGGVRLRRRSARRRRSISGVSR